MTIHHAETRNILPINKSGCTRCTGTGYLMQHKDVIKGVCFKCHGTGLNKSDENHPDNIAFDKSIEEAISRKKAQQIDIDANSSFTAMLKKRLRTNRAIR